MDCASAIWRILYSLDTQARILTVEAVETRGDAYR